jgi:hypothetical protein
MVNGRKFMQVRIAGDLASPIFNSCLAAKGGPSAKMHNETQYCRT